MLSQICKETNADCLGTLEIQEKTSRAHSTHKVFLFNDLKRLYCSTLKHTCTKPTIETILLFGGRRVREDGVVTEISY